MLPPPEKTLSGTLTAELQQSSRDVALGRFQVWITNGLDREILPRRIVYQDALLTRPVLGGRLRAIPSGAYRGYTLDLVEPRCGGQAPGKATVTVTYGGDVETFPVEDETGVVERWSHERCDEIAIEQIADLEWTSGIEVQGSRLRRRGAVPAHGHADRPRGWGAFTVDTVGGTPLFTSADGDFWTVGQRDAQRRPRRHHGAARPAGPLRLSRVRLRDRRHHVLRQPRPSGRSRARAQIRLAMSPEVTAETFAYAAEACGWEEGAR